MMAGRKGGERVAEIYVSLEDAADYESLTYKGLTSRIDRNYSAYKLREEPRECGGRPLVFVALSSLSKKARKAYKAAHRIDIEEAIMEKCGPVRPWYVETDLHGYRERHQAEYEETAVLAEKIGAFVAYDKKERTAHAFFFAAELGISSRGLYRHAQIYLEASAWAMRLQKETGRSYGHLTTLALCRKPRDTVHFPTLSPELRAMIENCWFDEKFRVNRGTVKTLHRQLDKACQASGVETPSYVMVTRYINGLMDKPGAASAAFLAERGPREWKNKFMVKGERDHTQLDVMEIVIGDEQTFDLFVSYVSPNGQTIAVRPKLIGWLDMRSRFPVGYSMVAETASMQDIKSTTAKMIRAHGAPKNMLIDNGKDYTGKEMTGHNRKERLLLDAEAVGFYRAMGVQRVYRAAPYEPWTKGQIERAFGTICEQFSKRFNSYVGTLTGSRTDAKVKKDIPRMLMRGELFTLEEFYELFDAYIKEEYSQAVHSGLKAEGEKHVTPAGLFANGGRYVQPAPPDSYIAMLMMKSKRVAVRATGIQFNKRKYMCGELAGYINGHVNIRYMPGEDSYIIAFTEAGDLIGEIPLAEKLNPRFYADTEQLANHKANQKRQLRDTRELLGELRKPYEEREDTAGATARLIGGLDLTIGKQPKNNAVSLPADKQYRQEMNKKPQKKTASEYLNLRADEAIKALEKLG
jgi:hypothetical protein